MTDNSSKPKLIAFDLDYTLWPFWVDTHVDPPFRKDGKNKVLDRSGKKIKYYNEVPKVLESLQNDGYVLAAVSRTSEIDGANQLLELLDWDKFFTYKEIYPGCKVDHFKRIKKMSGIDYSEMLFFDDEHRNKRDLEKIGLLTILVENGVTEKLVRSGLMKFATNEPNL